MKLGVIILIIAVLISSLCGCEKTNNVDSIGQSFSSYEKDDSVAIKCYSTVYFSDSSIDFSQFVDSKKERIDFIGITNEGFYYLVTKEVGAFSFELTIFSCDFEGNNSSELFHKTGYQTRPSALGNDEGIYIEHYRDNVFGERVIDYYNLINDEYISGISCNKNQTLSELQATKKSDNNSFEIINNIANDKIYVIRVDNQETRIINDDFLQKTEFYHLLSEYDYELQEAFIYDDNVVLFSCILDTKDSWSLFPIQCCVVFQYNFEDNKISFKNLIFAPYLESYSIIIAPN